jgi:hypothetical protein
MLIYLDIVASILIHASTFSIHPGATPNDSPLATFSNVTASPFTWTAVNYASGSCRECLDGTMYLT